MNRTPNIKQPALMTGTSADSLQIFLTTFWVKIQETSISLIFFATSSLMIVDTFVMKCKSTGYLVATFLGTDNLRHPYNSIVYCGSSFPYSIQTVNDISTRSYFSIYTCGYPRIKAMQYKRQV